VGHTLFGTPTPIGISTISGLSAGASINLFNLINTSGAYHNDYGWSISGTRNKVCNLSSPTLCLSAVAPSGRASLVLTTSTDPNASGFAFVGGSIRSTITGSCVQAGGLTSGATLSWGTCPGTMFVGVGFNVDFALDGGHWVGLEFPGHHVSPMDVSRTTAGPVHFFTRMDPGFYAVVGTSILPNQYVYAPVYGSKVGFFTAGTPAACAGSTTTTKASWTVNATGFIGVCGNQWAYGNNLISNGAVSGAADTNVNPQYF
jgi:hypothetical protein